MNKVTIEIDLDEVKAQLQKQAITTVLNNYFYASDVPYHQMEAEKQIRLEKIIKQVNWDKLPEDMKQNILAEFMRKIITGGFSREAEENRYR